MSLKQSLLALVCELRSGRAAIAAYDRDEGRNSLNHVGILRDTVEFVLDRNVREHGRYMPRTAQPVRPLCAVPDRLPDLLLLAWNFLDEVMPQQEDYVKASGAFIVPVPEPRIVR